MLNMTEVLLAGSVPMALVKISLSPLADPSVMASGTHNESSDKLR